MKSVGFIAVLLCCVASLVLIPSPPSSAAECQTSASAGVSTYGAGAQCGQPSAGTDSQSGGGSWIELDGQVCSVPGPHLCRAPQTCGPDGSGIVYDALVHRPDGSTGHITLCVTEGEEFAVVTPGMVLEAFRRVPLPASELSLDPEAETYVNLPTIFSTQAEAFDETVRIIGQSVRLQIEPSEFVWDHGDGSVTGSDTAGIPWTEAIPVESDRYLTYTYLSAGAVAPSVDTTWSARYSVAGGPWLEVPGTVTMEGAPVELRVLEAPPELHGAG